MDCLRVVCGVIARDGTVLAARRSDADGWEFPGGKVEATEAPEEALKRELAEELSIEITTCWMLDAVKATTAGPGSGLPMVLSCFVCPVGSGVLPVCREHAELRWLSRAELFDVGWLPADRVLAEHLGAWWDDIFSAEHL